MTSPSTETLLPRYERVRVLGRGGMGAVWLVDDAERAQRVAMKRVLGVHGDALVRFKREFRVVEGLLHPNVVRLYELGEDDGGLFFTMEPVDGSDLLSWCRGAPKAPAESGTQLRADVESAPTLAGGSAPSTTEEGRAPGALRMDRLAHVLPQIVEALAFLHAHGVVHRDLKPSNVLVRNDGVVKILDFGILGEHGGFAAQDAEVVGTIGYMSPEQIRGAPPTPESDLYSLGCMLFELAAGATPFRGAPMQVMAAQLSNDPPSLSTVVPEAPVALVDACAALMRRDPDERPTLATLAVTLLPAIGARPPSFSSPRARTTELIGRGDVQATLSRALDAIAGGQPSAIVITGPTGAGKSAVAGHSADEAARRGMSVLRGRGRSTERVAFNALDGAIDDLSSVLGRRSRRESARVGRSRRTAAAAFPALTRRRESADNAPPPVSRGQVFSAVVTLLETVALDTGGCVLWIDDLQWADADSLALLDYVLDARPPHVLVLATMRDDVGATSAAGWVEERDEVVRIELAPLGIEEVSEVVARSARASGAEVDANAVRGLATQCEGRPFLAELAGRVLARSRSATGPAPSLEGWLERDVRERREGAREVLGFLVAADGWVQIGDLAALAERRPGEVEDELKPLEIDGLVRRAGVPGVKGTVDLYHDAVRTAVASALGDDIARAHARFAAHLERASGPAHERVRHLLGAGLIEDAARLAPEAARAAEEVRAYGLAADLYETALRHPAEDEQALRRARASALERGGRYLEAASEWRALASGADPTDAILREAHALLAANAVSEGRRRLDEGLRAAGEPASGRGGLSALLSAMAFLRGPSRPRASATTPDPDALERAERDVRIGTMVTYFDPLSGIRFLRRARATFEAGGAALEVAKADAVFAYLALFTQPRRGPVPLGDAYMASFAAWLDRASATDAVAGAYPSFYAGVAAQREGDWDEAARALDEGLAQLEEAGLTGTFEHMLGLVHRAQIDLYGQRLDRVDAAVGRLLAASRDSDDTAIHCHVAIARAMRAALRGELDAIGEIMEPVAATWNVEEPTFQKILVDSMSAFPTVYSGGADRARAHLARAFREARKFRPLSTMYGGAIASLWAIVEAAAMRGGDRDASGRRVRKLAKLAEAAPPLGTGLALRAAAYAEDARGRPERALERLRRARAHAERFDQALDVAMADYQLGRRLGSDEGAALVAGARMTCVTLGVREAILEEDPGLRGAG